MEGIAYLVSSQVMLFGGIYAHMHVSVIKADTGLWVFLSALAGSFDELTSLLSSTRQGRAQSQLGQE